MTKNEEAAKCFIQEIYSDPTWRDGLDLGIVEAFLDTHDAELRAELARLREQSKADRETREKAEEKLLKIETLLHALPHRENCNSIYKADVKPTACDCWKKELV